MTNTQRYVTELETDRQRLENVIELLTSYAEEYPDSETIEGTVMRLLEELNTLRESVGKGRG